MEQRKENSKKEKKAGDDTRNGHGGEKICWAELVEWPLTATFVKVIVDE